MAAVAVHSSLYTVCIRKSSDCAEKYSSRWC